MCSIKKSRKTVLAKPNMLPLQSNNDQLLFQDLSVLEEDLMLDHNFLDTSTNLVCKSARKRRISISGSGETKGEDTNGCDMRKIMHRNVERQRRQEMAGLYASLRSLLPFEYIKGKRAISDHMHQAVNYIKYMEMNLKDLRTRRNKLINPPNSVGFENGGSNSVHVSNSVTVSSCCDGTVEILIRSSLKEQEEFTLSKVIKLLLEIGLNVFSCISAKANEETFLYKIQSEASDLLDIDLPLLQERLYTVINYRSKTKNQENHLLKIKATTFLLGLEIFKCY